MENLQQENQGVFDVMIGSDITSTIIEAIALSSMEDNRLIKFKFNDVTVSVYSDSNPELIYRDWSRALSGYISKNVGPNPNPVLTDEEEISDTRIRQENERRYQKIREEYEAKTRTKQEIVEVKLVGIDIELTNVERWQEFKTVNSDGYGGAIITYSERWAQLMQFEMANGKNLEDVADATSQEADIEGITGFMYGCAVSTLSQCWKYGEQLRRWHNIKTQLGSEGDKANESGSILNPAVMSVSIG